MNEIDVWDTRTSRLTFSQNFRKSMRQMHGSQRIKCFGNRHYLSLVVPFFLFHICHVTFFVQPQKKIFEKMEIFEKLKKNFDELEIQNVQMDV